MSLTISVNAIDASLTALLVSIFPNGSQIIETKDPYDCHYVYLHCRPDGSPFYVGKGKGRRAIRVYQKTRNWHHQCVVKKYGKGNIRILIIPMRDEDAAFEHEIKLISALRASNSRLCNYNDGGEGSTNPSLETRAKMSAAKNGKRLTESHIENVRASLKGIPKSANHVAKVSAALKGRPPSSEVMRKAIECNTGRKQSPETIEKRRLSNLGKVRSPEFKSRLSELAKARYANGTHNWNARYVSNDK